MSRSYNEIMETIHMSDEAHERILSDIIQECEEKERGTILFFQKPVRYLAVAAAMLVCVVTVPVIYHLQNASVAQEDHAAVESEDTDQTDAGIVECASAKELSEKVGFTVHDLKKENLPFEVSTSDYYAYRGELAEIEYMGSNGNYATYRMQAGNEDPSDTYNEYSRQDEIALNDVQITLKGEDGTDTYNQAVWTYKGYSYALELSESVSEDEFQDILNGVVN